jgi:MFS superfamily sulfate permease-like transporter
MIAGSQFVGHRLPGPLAGLILSIAAVHAFGLASHHGVAVLGGVDGGLPPSACLMSPGRSSSAGRSLRTSWPRSLSWPWRLRLPHRWLATIALLAVALVGIERGVAVAIILSLADRTRRSARSQDAVVGREPGTDHWIPADIGRPTKQLPGVRAYLVYAPLWYGNADYLRLRVRHLVEGASTPVHAVIVDADGISDIDYTGLQALRELATELGQQGVSTGIARASQLVHHDLKHGVLLAQLGADHMFTSVQDAADALQHRP